MTMKKLHFALAVAGALTGTAHAQSAIEIYGVADMGFVRETGDVGSTDAAGNKMVSGAQSGTRLGFKGTEDLGNGMKALFVLETGISADKGGFNQNNVAFARQSFVGLQSEPGTLTLGRQYTPYFLTLSGIADPFAAGLAGAAQNLMSSTGIRMNNTIKYASPLINNFSGEVAYGFSEPSGSESTRQISANINYKMQPLNIGLAYHRANNAANTDKTESILLAANWDFGVAKVFAAFANNEGLTNLDSRDFLIGATVPFGAHTFIASYINKDGRNAASGVSAEQWALGYTYKLSKRTNLYAAYGYINNDGTTYTVGNNSEPGSGNKALNLGVRHLF
jgi:predicted porin